MRAMEGFGVIFCVKGKILVFGEAGRDIRVQLAAKGDNANAFGSLGRRAFAEEDEVWAHFAIGRLETVNDLLGKRTLAEGEVSRHGNVDFAIEERGNCLFIVRSEIVGIWKYVSNDQSEGKGVLGV